METTISLLERSKKSYGRGWVPTAKRERQYNFYPNFDIELVYLG